MRNLIKNIVVYTFATLPAWATVGAGILSHELEEYRQKNMSRDERIVYVAEQLNHLKQAIPFKGVGAFFLARDRNKLYEELRDLTSKTQ